MNIGTMLADATLELAASGSDSARLDADVLLMHSLGIERARILSHPERTVSRRQQRDFSDLIERRKKGEPVSYILGKKEFWSLDFKVTPDVLIPRPETECLIEEVLRHYSASSDGLRICDIGTGSGIIAIVLAKELPSARITATENSVEALAVATENAQDQGITGNITFLKADLFPDIPGKYDTVPGSGY